MIKVFNGDCIRVEQAIFDRKQIIDKYSSPSIHKQIKFVITREKRVISVLDYKDILLKRGFIDNIIEDSDFSFEEARKYYGSIDNLYTGCCMGIVDQEGRLKFIVEYYNNTRFIEKDREAHIYQYIEYNFPINFEDIQVKKLLEYSSCFVFEYMEEYTVHFAKILLECKKQGVEYHLYSLDENVNKFFSTEEVSRIPSLSIVEGEPSYSLVISGKHSESKYRETDKRICYKSLDIMKILYEASLVDKLKCKTEKPFIIIEDEYYKNGLVDLMKHNMAEYVLQEARGKTPVININKNNTYGEGSGENVWDYFFDPVNQYSLDEVYASGNYDILSRKLFSMSKEQSEGYIELKINKDLICFMKRIHWKNEILKYCKSELPKEFFKGEKILGVIARGTDWNGGIVRNQNTGIDKMIQITMEELQTGHYDHIYLATEDYNNYCRFKNEFGNLIIASDQVRFNIDELPLYRCKWIAEIPRTNGGFEYGLDYMVVIYCLAQCDSLITSMPSGAYLAASALKEDSYRRCIIGTLV